MRFIALCASATAFLATVVILLLTSFSGAIGLFLASGLSALTAAGLAAARPSGGWRWGLWAGAAFLAYFMVVTLAYLVAGRPDWHPLLAAMVVTGASCATAAIVATVRTPNAAGVGAS
jgi:hypothetical protein